MLRLRLLTAAAAAALLAAPAAFAQTAPVPPAPTPVPATPAMPGMPGMPGMTAMPAMPAEPVDEAAPAQAATPAVAGNVIDVLTAQGNFTTLLAALNQAQLTETLKSRAAITIFAPTDDAFAAVPEAERTRLMDPANAAELRALLLYHVIVADVSSAQITGARGGVETANSAKVMLDGTGEGLRIDGATVTRADIDASNGAVFAIDKVLNPAQWMVPVAEPAAPAAGVTATTRPATPGTMAPTGAPASTTTTVASPPVANPTDGQVDVQPDPGRTTPPVQTPDPADENEDVPVPTPTPGG